MRTYAHKPRAKARRRYMTEAEYTVFQSRFHQHADANAPKTPDGTVKKASKYRNQKVEHDGIMFDSKHELKCWLVLAAMAARGEISDLQRQVPFKLLDAVDLGEKRKKKAMTYVADFAFTDANGRRVVQDAKSKMTRKLAEYRMKKHMMAALLGIVIEEV